jgi:hypothetical protein
MVRGSRNPMKGRSEKTSLSAVNGESTPDRQMLELRFRMLREITLIVARNLVEKAGSKRAIEILTPYMANAGAAMSINLGHFQSGGLNAPHSVAIIGRWANEILHINTRTELTTRGAIGHFISCPFNDPPIEMCMAHIALGPKGMCDNVAPDFEVTYTKLLSEGDDECIWVCKRKNDSLEQALSADLVAEGLNPYIPEDVMRALEARVLVEWLDIFLRATIDHSGKDEAMTSIIPLMRDYGASVSEALEKISESLKDEGQGSAASIIRTCAATFSLEMGAGSSSSEGEVKECPFSNLLPEICSLYEELVSGACQAIDQNSVIVFNTMMTKGDKTCHWTIRKKGKPSKEKTEEAPTDDPFKRLANKLIDGQITEEEFARKMALLKEHYPR